jgi:hypothetical protein
MILLRRLINRRLIDRNGVFLFRLLSYWFLDSWLLDLLNILGGLSLILMRWVRDCEIVKGFLFLRKRGLLRCFFRFFLWL